MESPKKSWSRRPTKHGGRNQGTSTSLARSLSVIGRRLEYEESKYMPTM